MSKKTKKNRKKVQLTKKEIDAMVQEVLDEAAKEAAESESESEAEIKAHTDAEVPAEETVITEAPSEEQAETAEAAAEPSEDETPAAEPSEDETPDEKPSEDVSATEESSETAAPSEEQAEAAEPVETVSEESAKDENAIEAADYVLPNVDENAPDPSGSKSVFLTVKEDGKLAIAANKEGDIIFEENVVPPEKTALQKYKKLLITLAAMLVVVAATLIYDHLIPKEVTVFINTMDGTQKITEKVAAFTVEEALEEMGVSVSDIDQVLPYYKTQIDSGSVINVNKRLEALATVDGKPEKVILIPGTVKDNLDFNEIEYDEDDIISPALTDRMSSTDQIVVKDYYQVVTQKEKTIPSGSRIILDPNLSSGVRTATEARDGVALYTYTTTYIDGVDQGTEEEFTKWITEPQDDLISLGTSVTGHSGEVYIVSSFVSNTTAYYMGENAYGAAGTHCHYGTCAVDPSVVPYGSILWVAGYGFAVANDCGGAIIGTNLDLYMRSTEECYSWGRRYVQAYVLGWA